MQIMTNDFCSNVKFENLNLLFNHISSGTFKNDMPMHSHGKYYYELHLIYTGKGRFITKNNTYDVKKGTVILNGPGIDHAQITDKYDNMGEYCLGFNISKRRKEKETKESLLLQNTDFWIGTDDGIFNNYFEMLSRELAKREYNFTNAVEKILYLIIVELVRKYTNNVRADTKLLSVKDYLRLRIIDEHFFRCSAKSSKKELSKSLNLTERQLLRYIRQQYGKSYAQIKHECIINRALRLLEQNHDIKQTANILGYENTEYFKKMIGYKK